MSIHYFKKNYELFFFFFYDTLLSFFNFLFQDLTQSGLMTK